MTLITQPQNWPTSLSQKGKRNKEYNEFIPTEKCLYIWNLVLHVCVRELWRFWTHPHQSLFYLHRVIAGSRSHLDISYQTLCCDWLIRWLIVHLCKILNKQKSADKWLPPKSATSWVCVNPSSPVVSTKPLSRSNAASEPLFYCTK